MNVLGAALIVAAVLITPISLHVTAQWRSGLAGRLTLRVWGVAMRTEFHTKRGADGTTQLMLRKGRRKPEEDSPAPPPSPRTVKLLWNALRRCDVARGFLVRHVKLLQLRVTISTGLSDAAGTALFAGALSAATSLLPRKFREKTCIRVSPDFYAVSTSARCDGALFTRLGSLVFAALLFAAGLAVSALSAASRRAEA